MTNLEFKAWFEGFCEGVSEAPTREQWHKVAEKVKDLNDIPVLVPYYYGIRYYDYPKDVIPLVVTSFSAHDQMKALGYSEAL